MPIATTGTAAWAAMKAAGDSARTAYMAGKSVLTPSEIQGLIDVMRAAELNALFLHLTANIVVSTTVVGSSATGGPVSGTGSGTIT